MKMGENYDNFPVGLRVLAVDDDLICLKLLETLLRKCHYHVTTSSQAKTALNMLRDNKDGFDLVISDVHMPDMDGFKLLELVGLEMDIPVIMLSANSDPKLVLKGVTHGACDYLVKPVRLEELKNVWQHVIRKKKLHNNSTDEFKDNMANGEVCESPPISDASDQKANNKLNRKRKDDDEDSGNDEDDLVTQKKARVVWSPELHQKFIAAVNQLGIEKAVPKKILDLMNIEGLTRENVASHLQKYRIYLKKLSPHATQHANMRAAAGLDDYRYMRNYSSVGTFSGMGRLPNAALSPYITSGMLGRLNTPANLNLRAQNLTNSITALGKTHPTLSTSTQNPFYFQGNLSSLEFDRFQKGSIENFDVTANNVKAQQTLNGGGFNSESYNPDVNGFTNLRDNFQLPIDSVRETSSSNCHFMALENGNEKSVSESRVRANETFHMDLPKWQGGFVPQGYDSFDDLMNDILKREQDGTLLNSDFGIDDYAFGEVV